MLISSAMHTVYVPHIALCKNVGIDHGSRPIGVCAAHVSEAREDGIDGGHMPDTITIFAKLTPPVFWVYHKI